MTEQLELAPLLSGAQTVRSIRDTGYKSTDYAIAELIDNAFQAKATHVLVLLVQKVVTGAARRTSRVSEIAVIDDGLGMHPQLLNVALSFGGSDRYNDREGIGRFGMGLPQASVSQATKTEVWTWQRSQPENAIRGVLDLDAIEQRGSGDLRVPWPTRPGDSDHEPLPDHLARAYRSIAEPTISAGHEVFSGTVVRWTKLDRLRWVRAHTILDHTEYLLGRIYRRFLTDQKHARTIEVAILDHENLDDPLDMRKVRQNDPLYLARPDTTTLEYWEKADPNNPDGDYIRVTDKPHFFEHQPSRKYELHRTDDPNTKSIVEVRFSRALPESRPGKLPGATTHQGRHAADNSGVSIIRADRELVLDTTIANEATDRWWGIEVCFSPVLDEVFGVTNSKQGTPYFSQALQLVKQHDVTLEEALERGLFDEDHPLAQLYPLAHDILVIAREMKREGKEEKAKFSKNTRKSQPAVTAVASNVNKRRSESTPTPGERQYAEADYDEERAAEAILEKLETDVDLTEDERVVVAENYKRGVTVTVLDKHQAQAPAFFWPQEELDLKILNINSAHPAYSVLVDPLRLSNEDVAAMSEDQAKKRLMLGADALAWMLLAWSRLELEHENTPSAAQIKRWREEWGRYLAEHVSDESFPADELLEGLNDLDEDEDDE
ncbi:MAG: ATP-binding protein [Actinomycetota bacterium]|nr:ATP-binding protein [Actinomycetota bacterium]